MKNTFDLEILPDGQVKIDSEAFTDSAHSDADELLELLEEFMGGPRETIKKDAPKRRLHSHKHVRAGH
jgi:hypothetical protein